MTIRWFPVVLAASSLALGRPASGQEVAARASTDSTHYLVGDAIRVKVVLSHPKGLTFQPVLGDTLGGFLVLGRSPFEQRGETLTTTEVTVAGYDSGEAVLPPLRFLYSLQGDSTSRGVETNSLRLVVQTVPVDTAQEFRDLKPPISIPLSLTDILEIAGGVLLLAALGYLAYRFWRRRKAQSSGETLVAPLRPAHVIALEELARLKEKRLWQQGLVKQYYSESTEIFRRYIENRYRQAALEQTTDEILVGLRKLRMPDDLVSGSERVLRRADLVKFAKASPDITEHEETVTFVFDFVDRTRITESAATAAGVKAHVGS